MIKADWQAVDLSTAQMAERRGSEDASLLGVYMGTPRSSGSERRAARELQTYVKRASKVAQCELPFPILHAICQDLPY